VPVHATAGFMEPAELLKFGKEGLSKIVN
jgi:hypothetical protein